MPTKDRVVSIHPYFRVSEGKLGEFRSLCEQFLSKTAHEPKCLYYGFSFNGDHVHCREAYEDAEGLLAHLANINDLLQEALKIAEITRLEIHGTAEEVAKLTGPLSTLGPSYFTLEYGMRREVPGETITPTFRT
ncbi:MAG: putative quinol monooxygenase [Bryobacteraceae bacterium]